MSFSILGNLGKFYDIFTKGKMVVDAIKTKNQQNFVNGFVGAAGAALLIAKASGHELPISDDLLNHIAYTIFGFLGLFNIGSTVASTDKIGLPPRDGGNAPIEDRSCNASVPEVLNIPASTIVQPVDNSPAIYDSENPLAGLDTTYRGG